MQHVCMLYRQIQIMLAEFRSMYSAMTIFPASFCLVVMQVAISFMWIDVCRQGKAKEQIIVVAIGMLISLELFILTLIVFGSLGKVYGASTNSRQEIRRNKRSMGKKQYRKFVMACPLVKVFIGDQNFVEPSSTLVIEEFVVDNLIGVLAI